MTSLKNSINKIVGLVFLSLPNIITRYIIRSFTFPFIVGTFFFTSIMLIFYLKEVIKSAIEKGIPVSIILELLAYSTSWTLSLTIPMAGLMAIVMAINNLNSDSEIIAMRAGGVSFFRIFKPILIIGVFISAFLLYFNHQVIPNSLKKMLNTKRVIALHDPVAVLDEGRFTRLDKAKGMIRYIYVEKIDKVDKENNPGKLHNLQIRTTEIMRGVFTTTELIVAREAKRIQKKNADGQWQKALRLYKGYIFTRDPNTNDFQRISFNNGTLDLNLFKTSKRKRNITVSNSQAMSTEDINNALKSQIHKTSKRAKDRVSELKHEKYKRIAVSFSFILFMFLGFPLGIVNKRSGKGVGFGISIIFIFIYYFLYFSAASIARAQTGLPEWLWAWLANFVAGSFAAYFYYKRIKSF